MTSRPIRRFDDPLLRRRADPVQDFDTELRRLVRDLGDTMLEAGGNGIAAPQIGASLRVFCYLHEGDVLHLVNPELTWSSTDRVTDSEGCLSFPEIFLPIPRASGVVVTGTTVEGRPVTLDAGPVLARVLQHEIDHLDGILFVDRLDPVQREEAMELVRRAAGEGEPVPTIQASPHPLTRPGR